MNGEEDQGVPSVPHPGGEYAVQVGGPRLRVRSIKVHELRDVRPGTELRFGDGFHLILGKNGSGKSTLLELIAAVSTLNFRGAFFAETPFHIEVSLEVGKASLYADIRRAFEPRRIKAGEDRYLDLAPRDEADVTVRVEHSDASLCQWLRARTGEDLYLFTSDPRQDGAMHWLKLPIGGVDLLSLSVSTALSFGVIVDVDGIRVHPEVWPEFRRILDRPGTGTRFDEALGALQAMVGRHLTVVRSDLRDSGPPARGSRPRSISQRRASPSPVSSPRIHC